MRAAWLSALLVSILLATPFAAADHPGSNKGLAGLLTPDLLAQGLAPLDTNLVHRLPTVEARFAAWDAQYPDLVERRTIGQTTSGFDLLNIRITDEKVPFDAPPHSATKKMRVYLDGGHHGNEFLGVELVMYYLEGLLAKATAGDEGVAQFLARTEVYATPIINVDGNFGDTRKNSRLVDPNRNYDFHWGEDGASDSPLDFTYRGASAFSESETKANAAFQTEISPDVVITMHTGIAEFYWPWGWTHDVSPDDAFFTSIEKPFENATNGRVDAMQGAELYIVSGASDDWAYGILGTPGFTFEVHEDQFIPVYGEGIPAIISDQLGGLDFIINNVARLGAWVEAGRTPDGRWVAINDGWGVARNVTFTSGDRTFVVDEIAPYGGVVELPADLGDDLKATYNVLLIDTSRERSHDYAGAITTASVPPKVNVPAPTGLALLAVFAVAAVLLHRRQ